MISPVSAMPALAEHVFADGKLLVYSDFGNLMVREAASLKLVTNLQSHAVSLSFAPHSNLLAAGHPSGVKL